MEMIFTGLIVTLICLLVPCGIEIYSFRKKAIANMPSDYEFPMVSDFHLTIKASLILGFIELIFRKLLPQYLQKYCKIQDDI